MKTASELIVEISSYIERLRLKEKHVAYYPSLEMTPYMASVVERYFDSLGFLTEFRKCAQCLNKYDVTIEF